MKKIIISLLLMAAPVVLFAQLKVKSNGRVVAGNELNTNISFKIALQAGNQQSTADNNVGIYSTADNLSGSGMAYGVYGVGANASNGCNFGVLGALGSSTMKGAGILGSSYPIAYTGFIGNYAGIFQGDTQVFGTLTASTIVQASDKRLKENVTPLCSLRRNTLDKVLDMNVVEYNYRKMLPSMILPDSVKVEDVMNELGIDSDKKHFGLIAQELQEIYPELVLEGQDGYLAINYIELVPILICSIQELKQELDELKGGNSDAKLSRGLVTSSANLEVSGNVLYQNTPNPFKEQTTIRFSLADDARDATICIFDMTGKMLKKLSVSSGDTSVSINGWELGEGMFLYTLMVNGKEIDTKKMIITK